MSLEKLKGLSARLRALVAIAVLLDGREAENYLEGAGSSSEIRQLARELAQMAPDLRMPLVGTILRGALRELGR